MDEKKNAGWWAENRYWLSGPLMVAGLLGGVVLFVLLADFWRALGSHGPNDDQADVRNIGFILIAIFGAGFAVWRGRIASEQNRVARDQFERSQERDYADLFTKAVEQLGTTREIRSKNAEDKDVYDYKPNIEVRLGAIYALERISKDSERDHIAVMETLCAYVRENAPVEDLKDFEAPEQPEGLAACLELRQWWQDIYGGAVREWIETLKETRVDIQAVLTVLGRRSAKRVAFEIGADEKEPRYRLDLRRTNLCKADMRKGDFRNALFDGAQMQGAALTKVQMQGARLWNAQIQGADIIAARMQNVDLWYAQMQGANLAQAQMQNAGLWHVQMQGAFVREVQMQGTFAEKAQMQGAHFGDAQMQEVKLGDAQLQGAAFWGTQMEGAELWQTQMQGADLRGAKMGKVVLWGAQMQGADLSETQCQSASLGRANLDAAIVSCVDLSDTRHLSQEAVESCFGCAGTILPEGVTRPRHWHPTEPSTFMFDNSYIIWRTARALQKMPPWVKEEDWTGW